MTFIFVMALHAVCIRHFSTAPTDSDGFADSGITNNVGFLGLGPYWVAQDYYLGFSYALGAAFAVWATVQFVRTRQAALAAGAAGSVTLVGVLMAGGCFLLGCCGSPMLGVYLALFGSEFLGAGKPLMALITLLSVMHRIISNSGNWGRAPQLLKYQRKHLLAKKNELTKKVKGATDAIIGGMRYQSIQDELERLEGEKAEVVAALAQVEADIAVGTTRRPTVDQVQGTWSQVTAAWFKATEDERRWLIQRLVKRVEVTAKDRASLQLTSIIETPGSEFVPEVQVGAGSAEYNTNESAILRYSTLRSDRREEPSENAAS